MAMKGPLREFIPLPPQQVVVRLPEGRKPRGVKLLVSGQVPRTQQSGVELRLTVPQILDHEVIAIDVA
jgi:hypothetical protein